MLGQVTFHDREMVMATGIYRVIHVQHRLPTEVTLIQGHIFPGCSKCKSSVRFEFLRSIKPAPDFRINLFNLPELPDSDEGQSREAA
jgi:hypothetical protein